jgi:hypothetical protein
MRRAAVRGVGSGSCWQGGLPKNKVPRGNAGRFFVALPAALPWPSAGKPLSPCAKRLKKQGKKPLLSHGFYCFFIFYLHFFRTLFSLQHFAFLNLFIKKF